MIRKTLMVSLACCLVLNLHVVAVADCPGTTPPPPSQADVDAFIAFQGSLFNTLFASTWVEEDLAYPLSTRVDGIGVYQGTNRLGQPFTFSVQWDQPIDLATMCITPEQLQQAVNEQVTIRGVAGYIITSLAEVPVVATAISGFLDGQLVSYFFVASLADPNGPFLQGTTSGGQMRALTGPPIIPEPVDGDPVIQPTDCDDPNVDCSGGGPPPPPPCPEFQQAQCSNCFLDYGAKADSANAALQSAIDDANDTAQILHIAAIATYVALMAGCITTSFLTWWTVAGGVAGAYCALGATAAFSILIISIEAVRNSTIENAYAAHAVAIAAAEAELEACLNNFDCCEDGCVTCE